MFRFFRSYFSRAHPPRLLQVRKRAVPCLEELEPRTLLATAGTASLAPALGSLQPALAASPAVVSPAAVATPPATPVSTGTGAPAQLSFSINPTPTTTAILGALANATLLPPTGVSTGGPSPATPQGTPAATGAAAPGVLINNAVSVPGGNVATSQGLNNLLASGSTQAAFLVSLSGGVVSPLTLVPQYLLIPSYQLVNRSVESGGGDNSLLAQTQTPSPLPVRMTPPPLPLPPDINVIGGGVPTLQEDGGATDGGPLLLLTE